MPASGRELFNPALNAHIKSERERSDLTDIEIKRVTVDRYEEILVPSDPTVLLSEEDWNSVKNHRRLLLHSSNLHHFTGLVSQVTEGGVLKKVPVTIEDFINWLRNSRVHELKFLNQLNEEVGYSVVTDPELGQKDTWEEKVVVMNEVQSKKRGESSNVGSQIEDKIKEFVFTTKTHDGRDRHKLNAAVVMFVPSWERADRFFRRNGFFPTERNVDQAEVFVNGQMVVTDVQRYVYTRSDWEAEIAKKHLQSHRRRTNN